MPTRSQKALREFRRMMAWIVVIAVLMVIGALAFAASQTTLTVHIVVATTLGVFFSVVLGTGLFALAFFSDKSGHDESVTDATRRKDER
jgi:uncharacterized membrane protein YbjE (DUF340 family)